MNNEYTYWAAFSYDLDGYVARAVEFPALSWVGSSAEKAIKGIVALVDDALAEMALAGEHPPEAVSDLKDRFGSRGQVADETCAGSALSARTFGQFPNLVVPETFDDPLPADDLAVREGDSDFWDVTAYLLRSPANARRLMEAIGRLNPSPSACESAAREDLVESGDTRDPWNVKIDALDAGYARLAEEFKAEGDAMRSRRGRSRARYEPLMPAEWSVSTDGDRVRVEVPRTSLTEHWLAPDEARVLGLSLRTAALEAADLLMQQEREVTVHTDSAAFLAHLDQLEHDAADPEDATEFSDWENPDAGWSE
ncbi:type II toxin-antitoxin system Phd/YefM family antitoxin [Mycobacteroides salmoniphilum]|uniref:hypothetical protein n=1 Tax=Mycobacteroides salmoniphilum TaxID=404941 RepID=UPI0009935C05|nr:hypothetical protein [Mycobacteroides salmoniphilum]